MDVYSRTPVNKLARMVTSQGAVTDSVSTSASELLELNKALQTERELLSSKLGLPAPTKASLLVAIRLGRFGANDGDVARLFQVLAMLGRMKREVKLMVKKS